VALDAVVGAEVLHGDLGQAVLVRVCLHVQQERLQVAGRVDQVDEVHLVLTQQQRLAGTQPQHGRALVGVGPR
jgi:hypothetical protein